MPNEIRPHGRVDGFSLIEMMIVVAIVAILTAIAVPSYTRYVARTNRVAAEACMAEYANYMERFYTTNLRYDQTSGGTANADPHLGCQGQVASSYAITQATERSTFTITATPTTVQQGRDIGCGALALDQAGVRSAGTDGCW
jgi:type IV pilus assembly protein PilE